MEKTTPNYIEGQGDGGRLTFDRHKITLLLDILLKDSDVDVVKDIAEKEGLSRKIDFHITLIGSKTGQAILEKLSKLPEEEKEKVILSIEALANDFDWSYELIPEYYSISKKHKSGDEGGEELRKSIIQPIALPDLALFYEKLNELIGSDFDIPFPHMTLFTTSTNEVTKLRGIGIYSEKEFEALNPERLT